MSDFSWTTFFGSLVGSGATAWLMVKGLSGHLADRWLAKYKSDLDKGFESYRDLLEQKRKRLEADLSHRVYVTQSQFDTEFNTVKSSFAALGKLKLSFNGLRPFLDYGVPESDEDKLKVIAARLKPFSDYYNEFVNTAESVFPFVPEDIYTEFEKCMKAALIEIRHIQNAGSDALSPSGYQDGEKQRDKFSEAYFNAARLTRERFKHLAVIS